MQLTCTDFELFELPMQFAQDRALIDARWKDLQRQAHPDKFAAQGAVAQRVAMQWSVRINEAYQRLKDPLQRAAYLCELQGAPINAQNNTAMPAAFLMQQMELREALDAAASEQDLEQIDQSSAQILRSTLQKLEQQLDAERHYPEAAQTVRALMFLERFRQDIENRHALLGQ